MNTLYLSSVRALALAIDAKDPYAQDHILRVQRYAMAIAEKMRLKEPEMEALRSGALLHDIGNLGVPEYILLKPGKLTPEEFATIQKHPETGAMILEPVSFLWPVVDVVRYHHERYNGTGYPRGLKGEEIPLAARILAVADVYDTLTSKRAYHDAWTHKQAVEQIRQSAGSQFDPKVVKAFLEVIEDVSEPLLRERRQARAVPADKTGPNPSVASINRSSQRKGVENISQAHHELLAIYEITQTVSATLDLHETLSLLINKIKNIVEASTCAILLLDPDGKRLEVKAVTGVNASFFLGAYIPLGEGITGKVAVTGEAVLDAYQGEDLILSNSYIPWQNLSCALITPLVADDRIIGTINLYHERVMAFSRDDSRILRIVSRQVGMAVQNARLFEETRESALTDPLTGLSNARYLMIFLEQELDRACHSGYPVAVLGMDLDHFKPVNDNFGHHEGDRVLKELGHLFRAQARSYDLVARYAGDEFIIVLPETGQEEAQCFAERLQEAVARYDPGLKHSELGAIRVGVSIGIACYPEDGHTIQELIARADENMYRDKRDRHRGQAA